MRKLLFIHGGEIWGSYKEYLSFLKQEAYDPFEAEPKVLKWSRRWDEFLPEYNTVRLEMPNPLNAKYPEWKIEFERVVDFVDEDTVLVGHSLGANFLAKYLSENKLKKTAKDLHLVAGCFGCPGGFNLKEDLSLIEKVTKKIWIYHSVDDDIVPHDDCEMYAEKLPGAKIMKFRDRGHFLQEAFPELIQNIRGNLT